MKRLLCLLLILMLPVCGLAEAAVTLTGDIPLLLPGTKPGISDYLPLAGGGALLNVLTTDELDGISADMLYLLRISANGEILWQTRYHVFTGQSGVDKYTLALNRNSVAVTHYTDLIGNDVCTQARMTFDLATGRQIGEIDVVSVPAADVPTITHCGDYRVEEYFGDYNGFTVPTRITHIPTGNAAEHEMGGDLFWTAFGDKLLCFQTGSEDRGSYWMYDSSCLSIAEEVHTPFGAGHCLVTHAVEQEGWLYLFVWVDGADPDKRTYAVYPMDEDLLFGDSIALFTLAKGHSLADAAACGDGFLLTEYYPWEWQQPARCALSTLSMDGRLTVLAPELSFPRGDAAYLLPGADDRHTLVLLREESDGTHHLRTYVN